MSQNKITFSQNQLFKVISYGEKIAFGNIENDAKWIVTNSKESIVAYLSGNQINDYVFEKPGNYEITYSEIKKHNAQDCNHSQFNERMIIKVSSVKMTFDFSKISFSEKIHKGQSCEAIFITVPVNVIMKENTPTTFTIPNVIVAGIGSEIVAKPVEQEIVLKNGIQYLKYQLSGIATKETYLMFDFVDINNQVQTYNHLEVIN